jgi:hypothetical protein
MHTLIYFVSDAPKIIEENQDITRTNKNREKNAESKNNEMANFGLQSQLREKKYMPELSKINK